MTPLPIFDKKNNRIELPGSFGQTKLVRQWLEKSHQPVRNGHQKNNFVGLKVGSINLSTSENAFADQVCRQTCRKEELKPKTIADQLTIQRNHVNQIAFTARGKLHDCLQTRGYQRASDILEWS